MIVSSFVLNAFEDYEIRNSLEISASIFCVWQFPFGWICRNLFTLY